MKTIVLLNILVIVTNYGGCEKKDYTNYVLYNVMPLERYQLEFLQNLEKLKYINVIFWTRPYKLYNNIQILVSPNDLQLFQERLNHYSLKGTILIDNVQKLFDNQKISGYTRMKFETFSWKAYHSLEDVYQWMTDISTQYSDKVNLTAVGRSAEGREILALEFYNPKAKANVIVEGAIHGNEWIATEFVTYLIYHIVNAERATNSRLKQVAKKFRWIMIPVANPDGYTYSMRDDHLWRKNRRNLGNGKIGVDLNKNFKYNFCTFDGSSNPNHELYCGPKPFSEPETQAISNYVTQHKYRLNYYFAFHAYGQKLIIPYSDRIKHLENFSEMNLIPKPTNDLRTLARRKAGAASLCRFLLCLIYASPKDNQLFRKENYGKQAILKMYKLYGVKYGIGTIYDTYGYRSAGDSVSWAKQTLKVKYALSFYLRDNGTYGYALPPELILPSCKEMLVGLIELMTVRHRHVARELFSSAIILEPSIMSLILTIIVVVY